MIEGLLYSQLGYDIGMPFRAAVCADAETMGERPTFTLHTIGGRLVVSGELHEWGSKWGRTWWIVDFTHIAAEGEYRLDVVKSDGRIFRSGQIRIARDLLWRQTFRHVALEQAHRRANFAAAKVGWFDAGMPWQEANSHAAYVIGMTDVLEFASAQLSEEERRLLEKQIINGCDYLKLCQDRAVELKHPAGSLCHEIPKYEQVVVPHDAPKAVVAWGRAARLLKTSKKHITQDYLDRARRAFSYVSSAAPSQIGFSRIARGLSSDFEVPPQWATRDLLMLAWSALELALCGLEQFRDEFAAIASTILKRQIPSDQAEGELYGHFYEFSECGYSEKAWTHSLENLEWGIDVGATFPNYLIPLIRACELWQDHPDAAKWREAVRQFAYGYFLPACRANPFLIVPQGYFQGEGLLNFAGLWHGMNAAYGFSAALALELSQFLADPAFKEISVGNLQWIAGLNVGVTRESLVGCMMYGVEIAPTEALPASMIFGVGDRWAGGWTTIRGSVCNGFSVGEQFKFDVPPTLKNDSKITLTDEDWITHSGGWLAGLSRLGGLL